MKPALRVLILNLHLYGGLLGAPYLVIYGLSSLTYNHPSAAVFQSEQRVSVQTASIEPFAIEQPERAAAAARDALGLIGFIPAWKTTRDEEGGLSFHVNRTPRSSFTLLSAPPIGRTSCFQRSELYTVHASAMGSVGELR